MVQLKKPQQKVRERVLKDSYQLKKLNYANFSDQY